MYAWRLRCMQADGFFLPTRGIAAVVEVGITVVPRMWVAVF
jgi:hypothetical protein